jgi:hypothetical protein
VNIKTVSYDEGLKERLRNPEYVFILVETLTKENTRLRAALEAVTQDAEDEYGPDWPSVKRAREALGGGNV